jgi:hypothetical protein
MDLNAAMAFMGSDSNQLENQGGDKINYCPTQNFFIPVNKQAVIANGTVPASDSARVLDTLTFTFPGNNLFKNDLMELNIIAAANWNRPIYFTQPYGLGLNNFFQGQGLTYRLEPLKPEPNSPAINVDTMYRNVMTRFKFGGAEKQDVYFDENGRRMLLTLRTTYTTLGQALAAKGRKDLALQVLNYGYTMLNPTTLPYGMTSADNRQNIISLQYAYAYYVAGDAVKGQQIADAVIRDCRQQVDYYNSLSDSQAADFRQDLQSASQIITQLEGLKTQFSHPATGQQQR